MKMVERWTKKFGGGEPAPQPAPTGSESGPEKPVISSGILDPRSDAAVAAFTNLHRSLSGNTGRREAEQIVTEDREILGRIALAVAIGTPPEDADVIVYLYPKNQMDEIAGLVQSGEKLVPEFDEMGYCSLVKESGNYRDRIVAILNPVALQPVQSLVFCRSSRLSEKLLKDFQVGSHPDTNSAGHPNLPFGTKPLAGK